MTREDLREDLSNNYPDATQADLDAMVEAAINDPDAEWVKIACSATIDPGGLGPSLDSIGFNWKAPTPSEEPGDYDARSEVMHEVLDAAFSLVAEHENPALAICEIRFACGFYKRHGTTMEELAKRHNVTKQAFSSGARKLFKALWLRPELTGRTEKARATMRRRNCNPKSKPWKNSSR